MSRNDRRNETLLWRGAVELAWRQNSIAIVKQKLNRQCRQNRVGCGRYNKIRRAIEIEVNRKNTFGETGRVGLCAKLDRSGAGKPGQRTRAHRVGNGPR